MAEIEIWNGNSTFTSGSCPFGFYEGDPVFQADADKVAKFCAVRLGYPLMDVELQSGSFYACFEEAVTIYGNEVFQYKIRENYLSMEGASNVAPLNNTLVEPNLSRIIEISKNYGTEAGVGGNVTKYKGLLPLNAGVQEYDLNEWAVSQEIEGGIEIRKVFYEAPPAILRYFDPYAGTGTGLQSLMDAFDFGSYSPGINFLLMPVSFDLMKIQSIEFNDQIRRSAYSFEIVNNKLKIFPIPKQDAVLAFEYFKNTEKTNLSGLDETSSPSVIVNVSEVPYENPVYGNINSIGKQWIYRYTLALSKELLAYVRGKYITIPIPGSEATLNQGDLLTDARTEKAELLTNLRELLDQTSRQAQLERKGAEADALNKTLGSIPLPVFIG